MGLAGLAKMHLIVNQSGEHEAVGAINLRCAARYLNLWVNPLDALAANEQVGAQLAAFVDEQSVFEQIHW